MNSDDEYNEVLIKLVLLGESGVGKSNIFSQYT